MDSRDSILITIKRMLGIHGDYNPFDTDIVVFINAAFFTLKQLGVGPEEGFSIKGPDEVFDDFIKDPTEQEAVKSYLYLKVRTVWDANSLSSSVLAAYQEQIKELEDRFIYDMETECLRPKQEC